MLLLASCSQPFGFTRLFAIHGCEFSLPAIELSEARRCSQASVGDPSLRGARKLPLSRNCCWRQRPAQERSKASAASALRRFHCIRSLEGTDLWTVANPSDGREDACPSLTVDCIRSLTRDPPSAVQPHRMRPRQTLTQASLRSLVCLAAGASSCPRCEGRPESEGLP
jgi:hypothetical protein